MVEPATPILPARKNDVIAASEPAMIWDMDMPSKNFFTVPDHSHRHWNDTGLMVKDLQSLQPPETVE